MQRIIQTRAGIKFLNGSSFRSQYPLKSEGVLELRPDELFMGMDYLKDDFSLVNVNIKNTPHYSLMELIENDDDLSQSDYFRRFYDGTLDARIPHKQYNDYSFFLQKHISVKKDVIGGTYEPIIVYKINDRFYIYDGKHRAALCAYLNLPIKCKQVASYSILCHNSKTVIDIMRKKACYKRNCAFFNDAINELENK